MLLVATLTLLGIWLGRLLLGRWFNHLSIYSFTWGICLFGYQLQWIEYEPISAYAWFLIISAWVMMFLGSIFVLRFFPRLQPDGSHPPLRKAIQVVTFVGLIGVADLALKIARGFDGGLLSLFASAGDIYIARTSGELSAVPYIGSLLFTACALAGVYFAQKGKLRIGLFPLIAITFDHLLLMGRAGLGMAAMLFLVSYHYTPHEKFVFTRKNKLIASAVAIVLFAGFMAVSLTRKLQIDFPGQSDTLETISEYFPIAPSLYSNFSSTPVAFSMYLARPEEDRSSGFGRYTFAPLLRGLAALGFKTEVPPYEEVYVTPVPTNTCTYLKNIYSDFGLCGVFMFPFLLGAVTTYLSIQPTSLLRVLILANLFVVVAFSVFFDFMLLGDWVVSLAGCVAVGLWIRSGARLSLTLLPQSSPRQPISR